MSGVKCRCGRFLARPRASAATRGEGYNFTVYLADVRGDCSRCGPDTQAAREGDAMWWWDWDAWKWPAGLEAL